MSITVRIDTGPLRPATASSGGNASPIILSTGPVARQGQLFMGLRRAQRSFLAGRAAVARLAGTHVWKLEIASTRPLNCYPILPRANAAAQPARDRARADARVWAGPSACRPSSCRTARSYKGRGSQTIPADCPAWAIQIFGSDRTFYRSANFLFSLTSVLRSAAGAYQPLSLPSSSALAATFSRPTLSAQRIGPPVSCGQL